MAGRLPLAVPIQNQPDRLLSNALVISLGLRVRDMLPIAGLAFVYLTSGPGPSILDLLVTPFALRALNHVACYTMPAILVTPDCLKLKLNVLK